MASTHRRESGRGLFKTRDTLSGAPNTSEDKPSSSAARPRPILPGNRLLFTAMMFNS
jgi:hypothetical protein